jgi:hypothetical protein
MRTILALAAAVVVGATAAAYATDRAHDGTKSAAQHAIPAGQIKINVDKLGYDVERTKGRDGIYKMRLVDRATGGKVDAAFDANTGELMYAKLAREDSGAERHEETRERKERHDQKGRGENRD